MSKFTEEFRSQSKFNQAFYVLAMAALIFYGLIHFGVIKLPAAKAYDCTQVTESKTIVIAMRKGNFEPSDVKAQVCDKLQFINESSEEVWPAVGPHPTHSSYPGFDSLRAIPPGERYEFQVNRLGVYTFHDHLHDGVAGRVMITKVK
jgi:plastocyanin